MNLSPLRIVLLCSEAKDAGIAELTDHLLIEEASFDIVSGVHTGSGVAAAIAHDYGAEGLYVLCSTTRFPKAQAQGIRRHLLGAGVPASQVAILRLRPGHSSLHARALVLRAYRGQDPGCLLRAARGAAPPEARAERPGISATELRIMQKYGIGLAEVGPPPDSDAARLPPPSAELPEPSGLSVLAPAAASASMVAAIESAPESHPAPPPTAPTLVLAPSPSPVHSPWPKRVMMGMGLSLVVGVSAALGLYAQGSASTSPEAMAHVEVMPTAAAVDVAAPEPASSEAEAPIEAPAVVAIEAPTEKKEPESAEDLEPEPEPETEPEPEPDSELELAVARGEVHRYRELLIDPERSQRLDHAGAQAYCSQREAHGYADWRVPRIDELSSALGQKVVGNNVYWSDSPGDLDGKRVLAYDSYKGRVRTLKPAYSGAYAICVRSVAPQK